MNLPEKGIYDVVVLDMQPISPPVGGGRIRLLGLYHGLGLRLPTRYIGTYDWPGEKFRKNRLSDSLEEITIPLSREHFAECEKWRKRVQNKTIIDVAFFQLAHLSQEYVRYARRETASADIVIFSHPWVYPLVKDCLNSEKQLIVYDSHNVEGLLRTMLLDDGDFGSEIVKKAVMVELELCHFANLVFACSHEDRELFSKLYQIPYEKVRVVPNGAFANSIRPVGKSEKIEIKKALRFDDKPLALFIGSAYPPNVEAANFIRENLAPSLPQINFAICGGVGDGCDKAFISSNLRISGAISEKDKLLYLGAADLAINPVFTGSGTNIKMFDYMSAGLPIVTTPVGARGIEVGPDAAFVIAEKRTFESELSALTNNQERMARLSESSRRLVQEKYSWEGISSNLGVLLHRFRSRIGKRKPFFTVIIPSFERHNCLSNLTSRLSLQEMKDFEVIVVDQSREKWPDRIKNHDLDLLYIHTTVKGAVRARNLAAFLSRGKILAFTDDDCEPWPDWLESALPYFDQPHVVGIEGLVESDECDHNRYRIVTNRGFQGIGFMTANLFLRSGIFNSINGFDERFDNPHFREDTDFAWRALEHGEMPFGWDVRVLHPAHPRKIDRESLRERNKYFEKDALLIKKHPVRYRQLFFAEAHYREPDFRKYLCLGAEKYDVQIPGWCREYLEQSANGSMADRAGQGHPAGSLGRMQARFLRKPVSWMEYDAAYCVWKEYRKGHISWHEALEGIGKIYDVRVFFLLYPLYKAAKPIRKCGRFLSRQIRNVRKSTEAEGFDAAWYFRSSPDLLASGADPFKCGTEFSKAEGVPGRPPGARGDGEELEFSCSEIGVGEIMAKIREEVIRRR